MSDKLNNLITDWILIMTSGQTIDGRDVTDKMVTDCAATYDRNVYTAKINWEHRDYLSYFGKVWETKEGVAPSGVKAVFARLAATADLVQLSRDMNGIFFSGELHLKFPKTGATYLYGLAATTRPACLGLEEFHLSERTGDHLLTEPVKCEELTLLSDRNNPSDNSGSDGKLQQILNILKGKKMSDNDIKTFNERLSALEAKFLSDSDTGGGEEEETDTEDLAQDEKLGRVLTVIEDFGSKLDGITELKEINQKLSDRIANLEIIAGTDLGDDIADVTGEFNDNENSKDDKYLA